MLSFLDFILLLKFVQLTLGHPATYHCGHPRINPSSHGQDHGHLHRIIGGHEAKFGSLPWMVMLADLGIQVCGGSIISENLVLTAAHCFDNPGSMDANRWAAYVGKHHVRQKDVTQSCHNVGQIIIHEGYNQVTNANDVAILVLKNKIFFNDYVLPICLPPVSISSHLHHGHTTGIVAGWGLTNERRTQHVLNQVTLPIIDDRTCGRWDWYGSKFEPKTTFCAGYENGGMDPCTGDSGGPFIVKYSGLYYQIGITSWGYGCAQAHAPGIYTDVTMYMTWIRQKATLFNVALI